MRTKEIIFSSVGGRRNLTVKEREIPMAEIGHFRPAGYGPTGQDAAPKVAPTLDVTASPEKYCVYSQTCGRFVATDVRAAHATTDGAEVSLQDLKLDAGTGLWILPYVEISTTDFRFPVDLVFLTNDCVVLATVESFPFAGLPISSARALSVLVFPAHTLTTGDMCVGDQLIISEPEEMKQHLQRMKEGRAKAPSSLETFLEQFAITSSEEQTGRATEEPAQIVVDCSPTTFTEAAPVEAEIAGQEVAGTEELAASPPIEATPWKKRLESRSWFTNLLLRDPADPRKAQREVLPGLIAYFFTGDLPVAHKVRDISATGLYIITNERWYPGTVIRVTLTDRNQPNRFRSITVHAKTVRWGSDGVGLGFVLEKGAQQGTEVTQLMERTLGVSRARIEAFLRKLKMP
ncbi:MAG: PilZ domain-containing protein [Terracidiphilus sp.]